MKAIVYARSGLELHELPKPTPKNHEVLIRIHATTAAPASGGTRPAKSVGASWVFRRGCPDIVIPGQDLAGDVEAVGRKVTRFKEGDPVVAWSGIRMGTYAEYICLPERGVLFPKPDSMTYEQAATLPVAGLDTTYLLRRSNIQRGERVLVNGAGGNMGTFAVQITKILGAEVTGVDSTTKLDMLRSIGTDHVVDYTRGDFLQSGETYDVIFDVVGNGSFTDIRSRLKPNGRYVTAIPHMSQVFQWQREARRSGKKVVFWTLRTARRHAEDFAFLKDLIDAGSVKAIIDKCFPLQQAAEAHQYIEGGHKKGHVVITVL